MNNELKDIKVNISITDEDYIINMTYFELKPLFNCQDVTNRQCKNLYCEDCIFSYTVLSPKELLQREV